MKRSEQIDKLAAALAKAQKAFTAAERSHTAKVETKTGGSYSFNYADLAAYFDVSRDPLGDNGLSVIQEATNDGVEVQVVTLLVHESGQWIEAEPFRLKLIGQGEKNLITPQTVGSAVTYARRYSLSALIGMASEADDDGNAASGNTASTGKRESLPPCPYCSMGSKAVIVGKPEYGGGLVCFKKKDGCGHTWAVEGHEFVDKAGDKIPMIPESPNGTIVDKEVKESIDAWRRFIDKTGDDIQAFNGAMVDLSNTSVTPAAAKRVVWAAIQKHAKAHGWELVTAEDGSKYFAEAVTH